MIFEPILEARPRAEADLLRGRGHELILNHELQQHAPALSGRILRKLRADLGRREVEIGLLDLGAIDGGDDNVVRNGGKRGTSN